jgi:hypothetical protein
VEDERLGLHLVLRHPRTRGPARQVFAKSGTMWDLQPDRQTDRQTGNGEPTPSFARVY